MRVRRLHLTDFRSWREVQLEAHSGANLLLGPNGSGKSNLLEALHVCALGFSPRSRSERDLVRWGAERFVSRLVASRGETPLELAASCDLAGRKAGFPELLQLLDALIGPGQNRHRILPFASRRPDRGSGDNVKKRKNPCRQNPLTLAGQV